MNTITVDFTRLAGRIKPLHGVNNSPVSHGEAIRSFAEAGIPYVRLHDTAGPFGGSRYVDIPNVFPDFAADPDDPAAYDFAFTDALLQGLTASGSRIFYRLGVTIENYWKIKAYHIHPPADMLKWAKICAGVVRHYNHGWNNGFHYGIEYWEIWNEPENPPMWTGTREQFFELYRIAANHLKEQFPELKIGGYAGCGFYAVTRPETSDFYKSFVTFFDEFLRYVTSPATAAPLDFFSWHLYNRDPAEIITHAEYVDRKLREYGLASTENIFDEWNYMDGTPDAFDSMKAMPGAAFVAAAFCLMQRSPVDMALYYDALPSRRYCGLYYFPSLTVTKTYYAFKAFDALYRLGGDAPCKVAVAGDVYAAAATDGSAQAVLLVNRGAEAADIALNAGSSASAWQCRVLDDCHDLEKCPGVAAGQTITVPPRSVLLLERSLA